ncbi:MAG TPA: hypothetical protein PKJ19_05745 [Flavobacteriales bacterium]|nr:hypothetical protein [Flavobacteriales bacterium]HNU58113.1 hypothetical protein [Flavobacteriales bacterium]
MRRILFALPFLLASASSTYAGGELLPAGARFAGMGYTGLTSPDLWSIRLNPAGLAGLDRPMAGAFYQSHWLSPDLAQQGLAVAVPLGKGTFGLSGDRFGYSLYNETKVTAGYAMRFGEGLRAAVQVDYLGVRLGENYGSASAFAVEVGMQAKLTDALWVGAHVYNPNRVVIGGPYEDRIPTLLRAGFGYTFSKKLLMTLEAEKDIDRPERIRMGVEYKPNEVLYLRTGITTGPVQGHFGAGFRFDRVDIDLAVAVRSQFGATPIIGVNYRFGE